MCAAASMVEGVRLLLAMWVCCLRGLGWRCVFLVEKDDENTDGTLRRTTEAVGVSRGRFRLIPVTPATVDMGEVSARQAQRAQIAVAEKQAIRRGRWRAVADAGCCSGITTTQHVTRRRAPRRAVKREQP